MTKTPSDLQDLRRKIYIKAKAEPSWRFWGIYTHVCQYRLHQDQNNSNQFVMYENWESTALHQEQFNKSYVMTLGKEMESLLAQPCQVIFANELF